MFGPIAFYFVAVLVMDAGHHIVGWTLFAAALATQLLAAHVGADRIAAALDRGPAVDVTEHIEPGLTAKEAEEFYTLHQEYLRMQEEKREEMQKEAKQNAPTSSSGRSLNRQ